MYTVFVLPYPIPEMTMPSEAKIIYNGDNPADALDAQAATGVSDVD
jgi:hypothetical protein